MAFYCMYGIKPGDSPDHKHETIAEMRAAHSEGTVLTESAPKRPTPESGTPLPASPPAPVEPASVAPSPIPAKAPSVESDPEPILSLYEKRQKQIAECGAKTELGLPFNDPRLALIKGMIEFVPDGYYATQDGDTATVDFLRISRPLKGEWKDHIKIQTQHSEKWQNRLALMPDGIWFVMDARVIDPLMLVLADHRGCARRYGIELQNCQVCNTELTDDRSRHYLIGPVCDKKPQGLRILEEVDDLNGGLSYEALVARGLPTRVWQESL